MAFVFQKNLSIAKHKRDEIGLLTVHLTQHSRPNSTLTLQRSGIRGSYQQQGISAASCQGEYNQETEEDKPPSYDDVAGDDVGVTTEVGEESVIYQVCKNNLRGRKQSNIGCGRPYSFENHRFAWRTNQ